ncbi:lysozyme g-like [Sparus aurata]|uniref:lysozyme g-like n=1 Tax=Sparus aurata TaxID=8175 RepID=UPI0011C0CE7E|nr:lysozyme g-like [Sparus aurata]
MHEVEYIGLSEEQAGKMGHGNIMRVETTETNCGQFEDRENQYRGGIAAYNMGDGDVHSYENVDGSTTGRDYSNDVVARAQWYKTNKG